MALQTTTNINVDFNDKEYIVLKAKQYDSSSRWITITCYDNGKLFDLKANQHTAYIRYRKADGGGVLNTCRINSRGEVLVELTEQMLAVEGVCEADLIIVNKGVAIINIDTGEIITIDNSSILSTQAFKIQVYKSAFNNSTLDSAYESDVINETLKMANANYTEVIQLAKSYAVGDAKNVRENEDFDNSKYYSQLSKSYAVGDLDGSTGTKDRDNESTDNAEYYSRLAKSYTMGDFDGSTNTRDNENTDNAKTYMDTTETYMNNASDSATTSQRYAVGGTDTVDGEDADNSKYYSRLSKSYAMGNADGVRDDEDVNNAKVYMENALNYATISQRYAVGGTDTVDGEDEDNAEHYYKLARSYTNGDINIRTNENIDNAEYYFMSSKSYAVGETGLDGRENENTDNAMYYSQVAQNAASGASMSESNAQTYMKNAQLYMDTTETYMNNASDSADSADISKTNAAESANRAAEIIDSISVDVESIESNANIALENAAAAEESATLATDSANRASTSENNAYSYMQQAVTASTNANELYDQIQDIATLNGTLSLKGTVEFAELAVLKDGGEVAAGDLYYVSDAFTTDDTFKEANKDYGVGTYVYYTSDGYWDCLETGIVTGIFSNISSTYVTGNIRLLPEDIGAVAIENVATIDEVKEFLGI